MAEAEIRIKTIDETGAGFKSVATRFDEFDQQVGNLEKNLKPLQEILKAGVGASAALAGLGAAGKNAGNLTAAFGDLQESFLGIKGAAETAGDSLGVVGSAFEGLMTFGTGATQIFAGLMAAFEVGKQMKVAYLALNTILAEAQAIQTATAAATTATAAAQTTAAASTGALTTATAAWNVVLALNPIFLIGAAVVAAAAAIAGLTAIVWRAQKAEEAHAEAARQSLDAVRARNEAAERSRGTLEAYSQRLAALSEKEKLTAAEQLEVADIVRRLRDRYGDLEIQLDKTTGKVLNYAEAQRQLKRAMLEEQLAEADAELEALYKEGRKLSREFRDSKRGYLWDTAGDEEIRQKIVENNKAINDTKSRRIAALNEITGLEVAAEKEKADIKRAAEEETAGIAQKGLEIQNQLREEIANETADALQKELAGLQAKITGREKELEALREAGKITKAQADAELAALKRLGAEREAQIRARHEAAERDREEQARQSADAEAQNQKKALQVYAGKITTQEALREKAAEELAEDERLAKMDPKEALKEAQAQLAKSGLFMQAEKEAYQKIFDAAAADGVLSDEERASLDAQSAEWQDAARQRDRWQAKVKDLEGRLKDGTKEAAELASTGPVEIMMRGSVEALRKEMALAQKDPVLEALREAEKKRDKQAERQIQLAEEANRMQKNQIENKFQGV